MLLYWTGKEGNEIEKQALLIKAEKKNFIYICPLPQFSVLFLSSTFFSA